MKTRSRDHVSQATVAAGPIVNRGGTMCPRRIERRIHRCRPSVTVGKEENFMETVINGTGILAIGILLGAMVFFSGVMAPLIFTKLEADVAGRFIRQVFPWYYLIVVALGSQAALAVVFFRPADAMAMACVALAGVIARQGLMPSINRARDAVLAGEPAAEKRFSRLHRLSVWINALQIITVGVVLARLIPPSA
ncbi:MAG TPA: DUF4149 domain-containing protein [Pseudolabrys sp.]|nr:DUF4149 domain-containing protein [Pseudolabrys sp.]